MVSIVIDESVPEVVVNCALPLKVVEGNMSYFSFDNGSDDFKTLLAITINLCRELTADFVVLKETVSAKTNMMLTANIFVDQFSV